MLNVSECWQVLECPENRESEDGVGLVDVAAQASDTLTQAGCLFLNAHGTFFVPAYFKKISYTVKPSPQLQTEHITCLQKLFLLSAETDRNMNAALWCTPPTAQTVLTQI